MLEVGQRNRTLGQAALDHGSNLLERRNPLRVARAMRQHHDAVHVDLDPDPANSVNVASNASGISTPCTTARCASSALRSPGSRTSGSADIASINASTRQ